MLDMQKKILKHPDGFYEEDCSREGYLRRQEEHRQFEKELETCRRMQTQAGYETLMKMRYNRQG